MAGEGAADEEERNLQFAGATAQEAEIEDRMQTAINLVHYDPATKQYLVSEEARDFLRGIKEKVAVIAVAGKYRTGKSYLLNKLFLENLNSEQDGAGMVEVTSKVP